MFGFLTKREIMRTIIKIILIMIIIIIQTLFISAPPVAAPDPLFPLLW